MSCSTATCKRMTISELTEKMILASNGNQKDIAHFLKVWAYAKTIGEQEGLGADTQFLLEAEAIIHDIACPLCRKKYGNTNGKHQEAESGPLVDELLKDSGLSDAQKERIRYVVCHHHTYEGVDGIDWQILLEADFLVNAEESGYSREAIRHFRNTTALTDTGKRLLDSVFQLNETGE